MIASTKVFRTPVHKGTQGIVLVGKGLDICLRSILSLSGLFDDFPPYQKYKYNKILKEANQGAYYNHQNKYKRKEK